MYLLFYSVEGKRMKFTDVTIEEDAKKHMDETMTLSTALVPQ